jgi:hypothetical protein
LVRKGEAAVCSPWRRRKTARPKAGRGGSRGASWWVRQEGNLGAYDCERLEGGGSLGAYDCEAVSVRETVLPVGGVRLLALRLGEEGESWRVLVRTTARQSWWVRP